MGQVLQEPGRELNMWQVKSPDGVIQSEAIQIKGLQSEYLKSDSIQVAIEINENDFDCGDLYITIYESSSKKVIVQNAFFSQCFVGKNLLLPIDDEFSEKIQIPGNYEISVEMNDAQNVKIIKTSEKFTVK